MLSAHSSARRTSVSRERHRAGGRRRRRRRARRRAGAAGAAGHPGHACTSRRGTWRVCDEARRARGRPGGRPAARAGAHRARRGRRSAGRPASSPTSGRRCPTSSHVDSTQVTDDANFAAIAIVAGVVLVVLGLLVAGRAPAPPRRRPAAPAPGRRPRRAHGRCPARPSRPPPTSSRTSPRVLSARGAVLTDRKQRVVRLRVTVYPDADLGAVVASCDAVLADLARVLPDEQLTSRVEVSVLSSGPGARPRAVSRCRASGGDSDRDVRRPRGAPTWAGTLSPAGSSTTSARGGRRTSTTSTGCSPRTRGTCARPTTGAAGGPRRHQGLLGRPDTRSR